MTWSQEIHRILEYPGYPAATLDIGLARYAPDDREAVEKAIAKCQQDGTPFDLEVRIRTFGDRTIWVRLVAEAQFGDDGSVARIVGALQDITTQHEMAAEADQLADQLATTVESISDAFYTLDHDLRFTYVNSRAEETLQRARGTLLGRSLWEEFPDTVGTELEVAYKRALHDRVTEIIDDFYYEPLESSLPS